MLKNPVVLILLKQSAPQQRAQNDVYCPITSVTWNYSLDYSLNCTPLGPITITYYCYCCCCCCCGLLLSACCFFVGIHPMASVLHEPWAKLESTTKLFATIRTVRYSLFETIRYLLRESSFNMRGGGMKILKLEAWNFSSPPPLAVQFLGAPRS